MKEKTKKEKFPKIDWVKIKSMLTEKDYSNLKVYLEEEMNLRKEALDNLESGIKLCSLFIVGDNSLRDIFVSGNKNYEYIKCESDKFKKQRTNLKRKETMLSNQHTELLILLHEINERINQASNNTK